MFKWLKRHFVPHIDNAYRPHFLLGQNIRQFIGVILFFELALFILPSLNFTHVFEKLNLGAVLPGVLATLTNEERVKNNLPQLTVNPVLTQAAQRKAEDMAAKSYFAHTSPEGLTPWYWLDLVGYPYQYAGENLAINFTDSADVTQAWMNSPTHRANIVAGRYTEMGTGIASGIYRGQETIFVAQVYANPKITTVSKIPGDQTSVTKQIQTPKPQNVQTQAASQSQAEVVLGESVPETPATQAPQEPTFIQETFSSPRQSVNAVLYVTLAIIIIALFLNIAIKFEEQHPDLIANGAVAAVVILGLYLGNGYFAEKGLQTTFFSYDHSQASVSTQ